MDIIPQAVVYNTDGTLSAQRYREPSDLPLAIREWITVVRLTGDIVLSLVVNENGRSEKKVPNAALANRGWPGILDTAFLVATDESNEDEVRYLNASEVLRINERAVKMAMISKARQLNDPRNEIIMRACGAGPSCDFCFIDKNDTAYKNALRTVADMRTVTGPFKDEFVPRCSNCQGYDGYLVACGCELAHYCGEECQSAHREVHQRYVCSLVHRSPATIES